MAKRRKLIQSQPEFTERHVGDSKVSWRKIIWSDETKMELYGHQTRCCVWQTPNSAHHHKHTPTLKDAGGSIMYGGSFPAAGPGKLVVVEVKMKAPKYRETLEDNLTSVQENYDLGENSVSSKTMTQSIQ